MPMTFDTFEQVAPVAKYLNLREPNEGESLEDYRCFVAEHNPDIIEAMELRSGRPWSEFTGEDKQILLESIARLQGRS